MKKKYVNDPKSKAVRLSLYAGWLRFIRLKSATCFLVCAALSLFSLSTYAQPELKGTPEQLRTFLHPHQKTTTIFAQAEEKAYTDEAIISLSFTTDKKRLSKSIEENANLRDKVTQNFISSGIPEKNINSAKFSSSAEYGWFGKKPDSYKVVNRMAITITNGKQLKLLSAAADEYEEIELVDTEFKHSKEDESKQLAKEKALKKIMDQKKLYEKMLNVKLTAINFNERQIFQNASRGALIMENQQQNYQVRSAPALSKSSISSDKAPSSKPSSFDEVVYSANISVEFKVEEKL